MSRKIKLHTFHLLFRLFAYLAEALHPNNVLAR